MTLSTPILGLTELGQTELGLDLETPSFPCPSIYRTGFDSSCCPCVPELAVCEAPCRCCPNTNYSDCVTLDITLISGSFLVDCLSGTYTLPISGGPCTWQQTFTPASSTPCNNSEGFSCGIQMMLGCATTFGTSAGTNCKAMLLQIERIPTGFETCFDIFCNNISPISCSCDPFELTYQFAYTQGPTCCAGSSSAALEGSGVYQVVVTNGCGSSSSNSSNLPDATCTEPCGFCNRCCDSISCCSWIIDGYPFSGTWAAFNNIGPLQKIGTPFFDCTWQTATVGGAAMTLTVTGDTTATLGLGCFDCEIPATYIPVDWPGDNPDSPCCGTKLFCTDTVSPGLPTCITLKCQQDPCTVQGILCCVDDEGLPYCPETINCEVTGGDCCDINGCYELTVAPCQSNNPFESGGTHQTWGGSGLLECGCEWRLVFTCAPGAVGTPRPRFEAQFGLGPCCTDFSSSSCHGTCVVWPGLGLGPTTSATCNPFFAEGTFDAFVFGFCGDLSPDCESAITMTFTEGGCGEDSSTSSSVDLLVTPKKKKGCGCKKSIPTDKAAAKALPEPPKAIAKPNVNNIQDIIRKGRELEAKRNSLKK